MADVKAVTDYLAAPAPATTVAFVATEMKKDAPLAKACAKAGDVLDFNVVKKQVAGWIVERFRQHGTRRDAGGVCGAPALRGRGSPGAGRRGGQAGDLGGRGRGR